MKKISVPGLSKAISRASAVCPQKTTMDTLKNIELNLTDGFLSIRAADFETLSVEKIKVSSKENARILVDSIPFNGLLSQLDSDPYIEFTDKGLTVFTDKSKYPFSGKQDSLPDISKDFKASGSFKINADVLNNLLQNTVFAVRSGNKEFIDSMGGVSLRSKDGKINFCGTTGKILAKTYYEDKSNIDIVISPKIISLIAKHFTGEEITISFNPSAIKIEGNSELYSLLIDNPFPTYEKLISGSISNEITIDKSVFISALKRLSTVNSDIENNAISYSLSENMLTVKNINMEPHGGIEQIECVYSGEEKSVIANAKNLQEIISHIESERIQLSLGVELNAIFAKPETSDIFTGLTMLIKE